MTRNRQNKGPGRIARGNGNVWQGQTSAHRRPGTTYLGIILFYLLCSFAVNTARAASYNVPATGSSTVTVTNGDMIYDSGGPSGSYVDNQNGTLTLSPATTGQRVRLTFSAFSTESCCDYVAIYDGPTSGATLLGTFYGTSLPTTFTSSSATGALTVRFYTDGSVTSTGFAATVSLVAAPSHTVPVSGSSTVTVTDGDGIYDSGGPSGNYGDGQDGLLTLLPATAGKKVRLTFSAFSTESCCDYVAIYDGPTSGATLLGTFYGTSLPTTFTSSSATGALTVRFYTDGSVTSTGFAATASLITVETGTAYIVPASGSSTVTVTDDDRIYDSGGASGDYGNSQDGLLTLLPATADKKVRLTFSAFSTESCCDYVAIYDGPTSGATLLGTFYGTSLPTTFTSSSATGALTVRFYTDGSVTSTGFAATVSLITVETGTAYIVPASGSSTVTVTDDDRIYDSGGASGAYGNSQNGTLTLLPATAGKKVRLTFSVFSTESCCDYVDIYDGPSSGSTLLGTFYGTSLPSTFTSTASGGALTIRFYTDGSVIDAGFAATVALIDAPVSVSLSSQTNVACNGGSTGTATVSASGGTPGYTYSWSPIGGSGATGTGLSAGTYTCTVTDAASGTATVSVTITQPPAIVPNVFVVSNVACFGGSTGSVATGASGGTTPYTYTWSTGATTSSISDASAGTYTCWVTDQNGCVQSGTATVTQPAALVANAFVVSNVACNSGSDGSASAGVSGGTAPFTYTWSNSATTQTISDVPAGTYTCYVTDQNGCTTSSSTTVTQPTALTASVTAQTNVSCNGAANGSATVSGGGGTPAYTYSWSNGATTATAPGLVAGFYTCTVTDTHGCTATTTANITQPSAVSASVSAQTNVLCFGASTGSATISASGGVGGYTYAWSGGGTSATKSGLAAGSYTCTVTDANSCTTTAVATITQPASALSVSGITGGGSYCVGNTINLLVTGTGGTGSYSYSWSGPSAFSSTSQAPSLSSVTTAQTGVYTATVTDGNGCTATGTVSITVNTNPGASTGETFDCVGGSITLSNATGGGTWSSSNTAIATVGSASGVVTGVAAGTVNITYALGTSCFSVKSLDINPPMAAITGTTNVCIGTTSDLDHSFSGGTWSASTGYYATINSSTGVVTGVNPGGYTTVTYMVNSGCTATASVYTSNVVLNITGGLNSCEGLTTYLSVPGWPGGTWTTTDSATVYVNASSGAMLGVAAGTMTVTYNYGYCFKAAVATVNAVPAAITGSSSVCEGSTTSMSCATGGGVWSSTNAAKATIDGSGTVTGVSAGSSTISYTLGTGCASTKVVTVGAMPAAITGTTSLCAGATTTLTCTTTGGTWSSSATGTANIVSTTATTAVISGVAAGGATISYNHPGGCVQTVNVTVAAPPSAIGGTLDICVGGTSTLTGSDGGTWSSSSPSVASIGSSTGVATGLSAGTANITYRTSATCYITAEVTVSIPADISGALSVCKTYTTTFTHPVGGGTWSTSNASVASVDGSGVVTGVNAGSAYITYHIGTGCYAVKNVFVYNNPNPLTGSSTLCEGAFTVLTSTSGGSATWSTSDAGVATVVSGGSVTGVAAGVADITYTATATGCYVTKSMTVNEMPAAITGSSAICVGVTEAYTSSPSGGTWTSSSAARATIGGSSGVATGLTPGGTTIRYTLSTGCQATKAVTVTALPGGITGAMAVCVGNSVLLTAATSGSTWSTSASGTASISATTTNTATVDGISSGSADISYTNAAGCSRVATVTVNAAVADIVGEDEVCLGGSITLTNATSGGTWSRTSPYKVGIGTYTGVVTGSATGVTTISYKVSAGCYTTKQLTVNAALPNIIGATYTCSGDAGAVTFTNGVSGGTWSSSNTSVAVVGSSSGIVTGVLMGGTNTNVVITYATSPGCTKTKTILIKPQPIITGSEEVSVGGTTAMTGSPSGGAWSSSASTIASISGYGVVTGIAGGSATISYTYSGCVNTKGITVTGGEASRPAGMTEEAVVLFSVFPNPSHGTLSVSTGVAGTFAIYTVDGKLASASELTAGVNAINMPSGMAAGTYMCRFQGVDGSVQAVRLVYEP